MPDSLAALPWGPCCLAEREKGSPRRKAVPRSSCCLPCLPLGPGTCELNEGVQAWYFGGVFLLPVGEKTPDEKIVAATATLEGSSPWLLGASSRRRASGPEDADCKAGESPSCEPGYSPSKTLQRTVSKDSNHSVDSRFSRLRRALTRKLSWRGARPNLHGDWICVRTWGLDAFLKSIGVSKLERMAATRAPWPSWEFSQKGDAFTFVNHTCFGDLTEEFMVGGPEYTMIDARKQRQACTAFWEGGALVIERCGPQGRFREERRVDAEGLLQFVLRGLEPGKNFSWGRVFRRK